MKLQYGNEYFEVNIIRRNNLNSSDYWDGNWLKSGVKINASGFTSIYSCDFRSEDFLNFYNNLLKFYENSIDKVEFSTMEGGLYLLGRFDVTGNVNWTGIALPIEGNEGLPFSFTTDNVSVLELIKQVRKIVEEYPVIGINPHDEMNN